MFCLLGGESFKGNDKPDKALAETPGLIRFFVFYREKLMA